MPRLASGLLKFILFLGLGILLIWLATHHLDPSQRHQIGQAFRSADYWVLVPSLVAGLASHVVRSLRWRLLIKPLGFRPSLIDTFCAVMIGYLSNLALPRLGEITRCAVLARYERIPPERVIGTMIAERAVDAITLALLILATVLLQVHRVGHFFYHDIWLKGIGKLTPSGNGRIWIMAAVLILVIGLGWIAANRFRHTMMYVRFRLLLVGVWEGFGTIGRMKDKSWFMIYTVLLWGLYFLMVYIGFFCLKSTSRLGWEAGLSVLAFGSIGMIVTQGGIGAYQLLVQRTLANYGIGLGAAYALGWIIWLAQTLLVVVLGFICLILLPIIHPFPLGQIRDHPTQNP